MSGSQKFIARNRAPRVQIEYDVELYGSQKTVQLPFVMGVMSDLVGKSRVEQPAIADRKFLEIDADNFDGRMQAMAPRVAFAVPNTLTGEGNLEVDLTFEKMSDFTPAAIAAKVDALRPLLEARQQLATLMAYMDGKAGAEALIERILANPALLSALSGGTAEGADREAALASLRAMAPAETAEQDRSGAILDGLRAAAPVDGDAPDTAGDVLAALRWGVPPRGPEHGSETGADDILVALAASGPAEAATEDAAGDILAGLAAAAPETADADRTEDTLAGLRSAAPSDALPEDRTGDVLDSLRTAAPEPAAEADGTAALLAEFARSAPDEPVAEDGTEDLLAGLAAAAPQERQADDGTDALLAELAASAPVDAAQAEDSDAVLAELAASVSRPVEDADNTEDLLAELAAAAPGGEDESGGAEDVLSALADFAPPEAMPEDGVGDLLADLAASAPEGTTEADDCGAVLADLAASAPPAEAAESAMEDLLGELAAAAPSEPTDGDGIDDLLGGLAAAAPGKTAERDGAGEVSSALAASAPSAPAAGDGIDDLLADLAAVAPVDAAETDGSDTVLAELAAAAPAEAAGEDSVGDLLADLAAAPVAVPEVEQDLGDLLADLAAAAPAEAAEAGGVEDLLADLAVAEERSAGSGTEDLLPAFAPDAGEEGGVPDAPVPAAEDFDDLLADLAEDAAPRDAPAPEATPAGAEDLDDLDNLLGGLNDLPAPGSEPSGDGVLDDLDDLLGDLGDDPAGDPEGGAEAIVAEAADDLDDLLGGLGAEAAATPEAAPPGATLTGEPALTFATMAADRPAPERLNRRRFRLAILGDFSGRAARGAIETGAALAARPATLLDPDTVEQIIESFATDLVLPLGKEGAAIAVPLKGLDDLHPDELYEKVELFAELAGLRRQLAGGATAASAARRLQEWGQRYGTPVAPPRRQSGGNAVRADLRLSDFQRLIGATAPVVAASPIDDLLARVVGPHIRALPDPDAVAMTGAVDQALSAAMRMLLHHPEFQSVEAQWRALDLIARTVETDDTLDVMLYDISAEEIAADLASHDDLSQSGFARLLTEAPLDPETGRGGYSALIGLYTFEETPPHAELLGRIARVAAHVDAPFLAAIGPGFLEVEKPDRHPLVAQAWDGLRAMPEAGYLGLAAPRFLLRRPYGAKTEPIYEFDFEEFTMAEGLSGLLWGNPAVLAAILLAQSFRRNGPSMELGSVMSLGGMPYHYVTDRYGDQVALPCTERNLTQSRVEFVMARGLMPVVSIKGRDEVRLASFQSLAGGDILGPWNRAPRPDPSPPLQTVAETADLDDLLAGFAEEEGPDDPDGIDADLAALLDEL